MSATADKQCVSYASAARKNVENEFSGNLEI